MPPDYLYKYTPLRAPLDEKCQKDEERQKQLDALLLTANLWFAAPESFNDPMDCKPGFTFNGGTSEQREKFRQTVIKAKLRHDYPSAQGEELKRLRQECEKQYPQFDETLCQLAHELLPKDLQNLVGVLCLSECERDPVMFYHYAAGHTGMCLKFRSLDLFAHAQPVQYSLDYPIVEFFDDTDNEKQYERIFLTKYRGWKYEREWRVINFYQDASARLTPYPIGLLEGVIFGYLMPPEDRDYAIGLLRKRGNPVMLYEAKLSNRHYLLDVTPIGTA